MRAFLAALMIVSMTAAASAQATQGIVDRGKRATESGPQEAPKKRANEKDYKSSLDRLPDKKFDPWGSVR
jgi:hypothetical protein